MADTTYDGSCHCGAVRYQVTIPPPQKAFACNYPTAMAVQSFDGASL